MEESEMALAATGVCRGYGRQQVLEDFSLSLEAGGFAALMGPSGSGKSTFLHIAAGLLAADAGRVVVGGREITRMSDAEATRFRRRHVGVVFQAFNLLSERTVRENILLPLRLDGVRADAALAARLAGLAARLGLSDKLGARPGDLSGGEQQRVAIARALLGEPDVILADEPTGNLDMRSARDICEMLKGLETKSAILVITHDPVVAACARQVHFLRDGRVAATCETCGEPSVVSARYLETYG